MPGPWDGCRPVGRCPWQVRTVIDTDLAREVLAMDMGLTAQTADTVALEAPTPEVALTPAGLLRRRLLTVILPTARLLLHGMTGLRVPGRTGTPTRKRRLDHPNTRPSQLHLRPNARQTRGTRRLLRPSHRQTQISNAHASLRHQRKSLSLSQRN